MKTVLLTTVLLFFGVLKASACMCTTEPIDSAYKRASVVFIGKVREIVDNKLFLDQGREVQIAIFDVLQGFKNSEVGKGPISVIDEASSCSYYFEEGKTYVVFAYSDYQGIHTTNQCTRTQLLDRYETSDIDRLKSISADYISNSRKTGIVQMLAPKYHDMINNISQLEKHRASSKMIIFVVLTLLLISIGLNIYLIKRK